MSGRRYVYVGIAIIVLLLGGLFVRGLVPVLIADEVRLKVSRFIKQEDGIRLSFPIGRLNLDSINNILQEGKDYPQGTKIWVELSDNGLFYEAAAVYDVRPEDDKICIRGILSEPFTNDKREKYIQLIYGIEIYATDDKTALAILKSYDVSQDPDCIEIRITGEGVARIKKMGN